MLEIKTIIETETIIVTKQIEYNVTEISNSLKRTVEENFKSIRVRGEISGAKLAPSGHLYFSLKDTNSVLASICWKGVVSKLAIKPEEGLEVICTGSITTFAGQSKYQLIVEKMEHAGIGALMALLAQRKEMLAKEGLFDLSRKKPLPYFPKTIGIITSPTGAVIKDILHRLRERMPTHVILWPVLVQGEQAAAQIASAINGFNKMEKKPDLLIIARGGGSIEDLWAFNDEDVVRAVANSQIPTISAIGHETDFTLIDYASDVRAPTPTAAAEIAVPVRAELQTLLASINQRLTTDINKIIIAKNLNLIASVNLLPNFNYFFTNLFQRLDEHSYRLINLAQKITNNKLQKIVKINMQDLIKQNYKHHYYRYRLNIAKIDANNLLKTISNLDERTNSIKNNLVQHCNHYITAKEETLSNLDKLLNSYSYINVINRGFAIVRSAEGKVISSKNEVAINENIMIEMKDGVIKAITN